MWLGSSHTVNKFKMADRDLKVYCLLVGFLTVIKIHYWGWGESSGDKVMLKTMRTAIRSLPQHKHRASAEVLSQSQLTETKSGQAG